jgi:putative nucleotidyltransferase with HDIG domain
VSLIQTSDIASRVRELPALPAVVVELIQSLGNDDLGAEQLARKISNDQALAAKTLRLANSSFYGMSRQVTSITDATAILGLRTLRGVAMAAGLAGSFPATAAGGFDFKAFWRHSIGTALCARAIAAVLRQEEEAAFTLGLLHDIGRLALATAFAPEYARVLKHQREHDLLPLDAERAVLGTDHCVVGGLIAEHWRFSPAIAQAIVAHHAPNEGDGSGPVDLLHVADNMAHALGLSQQDDDTVPPLSMPAWSRLALDEARCMQVFKQAEAQHESVCQALLT